MGQEQGNQIGEPLTKDDFDNLGPWERVILEQLAAEEATLESDLRGSIGLESREDSRAYLIALNRLEDLGLVQLGMKTPVDSGTPGLAYFPRLDVRKFFGEKEGEP